MSVEAIEASVVINHAVGLHARPSVKLTKLAKTFEAVIELSGEAGDVWIDAKSIVRVMALKLRAGETLRFRASGADADDALNALVGLVERDFDESAEKPKEDRG